jgi:hypothetical protein
MSSMPYAQKDFAPAATAWTKSDGSPAQQNSLVDAAQSGSGSHSLPSQPGQAQASLLPSATARGSSPTSQTTGTVAGQSASAGGRTFYDVAMLTATAGPDPVPSTKSSMGLGGGEKQPETPIIRTSYVAPPPERPAPVAKPFGEKRQNSELPPIVDTKLELQPPPTWPMPHSLPPEPVKPVEVPVAASQAPGLLPFSVTSGTVATAEMDQMAGQMPTFRMFNSKRFTLNYEVRDGGANGQSHVEVWGTRDLRSWKKYDAVQQAPHAYVIEVKDEGTYGFTMVARSAGESKDSPKPGELPQLWVTIDTLKPVVQLLGVEMSLTAKSPSLVVRWLATDKNFGKRPMTISYAEQPEGPWLPLATGLENNGRCELPVTTHLPHRTYLRVEATDLAGNSGTSQTVNPLRLDVYVSGAIVAPVAAVPEAPRPTMPAPTVNILGVEPTGN